MFSANKKAPSKNPCANNIDNKNVGRKMRKNSPVPSAES